MRKYEDPLLVTGDGVRKISLEPDRAGVRVIHSLTLTRMKVFVSFSRYG